jgi:predicted O-methyltransferase YrrM
MLNKYSRGLIKLLPKKLRRFLKNIYYLTNSHSHSELLDDFLSKNKISNFLEIGVNEGSNLFYLAKKHPNIFFWGVDPYYQTVSEIEEVIHGIHKTVYENDKYTQMLDRIRNLKLDNITLIKKTSFQASNDFSDCELDFVFIDGLHSYENVVEDINLWLPKVKKGGVLAGHDFSLEWFSVVRAVEDTIGLNNIIVDVPSKVWFYIKDNK